MTVTEGNTAERAFLGACLKSAMAKIGLNPNIKLRIVIITALYNFSVFPLGYGLYECEVGLVFDQGHFSRIFD